MLDNLKCMFLEDFSGEENREKLKLEHQRLRTVFSMTGNLMIALLVFALLYFALFPVKIVTAVGIFFLWTGIFLGLLAAFEKMFKDIENSV